MSNRHHNHRPHVWHCLSERFANVNVVSRVPHSGGGIVIWAGIKYGQWTRLHFINGNLNAQRHCDEILRPIFVPFIHSHHLMFQHDNARPHVTRICTQFLEAEHVPVLPWPAYSPAMSPIEHVWDTLDWRVRQRVPIPANIQQLRTAIEEEWNKLPQATINSLISFMWRRCVTLHEAAGGHTTYRPFFSNPHLYLGHRYLWPTDAYLYSQSCEIHRLRPNEFIQFRHHE